MTTIEPGEDDLRQMEAAQQKKDKADLRQLRAERKRFLDALGIALGSLSEFRAQACDMDRHLATVAIDKINTVLGIGSTPVPNSGQERPLVTIAPDPDLLTTDERGTKRNPDTATDAVYDLAVIAQRYADENKRFRSALEKIAEFGGGDGGDWVRCCEMARIALGRPWPGDEE